MGRAAGKGRGVADRHSATEASVFSCGYLSAAGIRGRPRAIRGTSRMLYAILCYNDEDVVYSWSKEEDDAVMAKLDVVHQKLAQEGKLGPAARLLPTTA